MRGVPLLILSEIRIQRYRTLSKRKKKRLPPKLPARNPISGMWLSVDDQTLLTWKRCAVLTSELGRSVHVRGRWGGMWLARRETFRTVVHGLGFLRGAALIPPSGRTAVISVERDICRHQNLTAMLTYGGYTAASGTSVDGGAHRKPGYEVHEFMDSRGTPAR